MFWHTFSEKVPLGVVHINHGNAKSTDRKNGIETTHKEKIRERVFGVCGKEEVGDEGENETNPRRYPYSGIHGCTDLLL